MSHGGKGDTQRPTDHKEYTEAHERIFGKRPPWYVRRDNERAVERCPGCEACINSACGRDECPKGWPKATKD